MKKGILTLFLSGFLLSAFAQTGGITHIAGLNYPNHITYDDDTLLISATFTQTGLDERYILKFAPSDNGFHVVHDSTDLSLKGATKFLGNTGLSPYSKDTFFYTNDKWTTFSKVGHSFPSTQAPAFYRTNNGFVSVSQNISQTSIHYSADGVNWSATESTTGAVGALNVFNNFVDEVQGKTYFIQMINTIKYSYDGGQTFQQISTSGAPLNLNKIHIIDTNDMIAYRYVAPYSMFDYYRSTDGGANWQGMNVPGGYGLFWIQSMDSLYFRKSGTDSLFLSNDYGSTMQFYSTNYPSDVPNYTSVFSARDTWHILGDNAFTTKHIDSAWTYLGSNCFGGHAIDFNGSTGFIGTLNFRRTHDGATSFDDRHPQVAFASGIRAVTVLNDSTYVIADSEGDIYKSTDDGQSWTKKLNVTGTVHKARSFYRLPQSDTLVLTHYDFRAIISVDGGENWQNADNLTGALHYCMAPGGKIYAVNNDVFNDSTRIYEFEADGYASSYTTVHTMAKDSTTSLSLKMFDQNTGYLVKKHVNNGKVYLYSTQDTWNSVTNHGNILNLTTAGPFNYTYEVYTPAEDTIYLVKMSIVDEIYNGNTLYFSFDGGSSWDSTAMDYSRYPGNPDERIDGIYFFNGKDFLLSTTIGRVFLNKAFSGSGGSTNYISELVSDAVDFMLYPNPATDALSISCTASVQRVLIYDLSGKLLLETAETQDIDIASFDPGVFIVQIQTARGWSMQRFVKR